MIYFFDEAAVAAAHNLEPVPGPVEKIGTVLEPDRPSDGKRCMSFASSIVPLEDGRWRMYYSVSDFAANLKSIAMAESADGLHWEKPMLGQVQVDGRDTNRLAIKGLAEGVRIERCTQPQVCQAEGGRWRMFFWVNHRPFLRYLMAESSDGLHWEVADFERPIIYHPRELGAWIWTPGVLPPVAAQNLGPDQEALGRFVPGEEAQWGHLLERLDAAELVRLKGLRANDAVYVYRDVERGLYELYAPWPMCNIEGSPRRWEDDNAPFMLRAIHRRTSTDGQNWSDADLIIAPDAGDRPDQQFYYLAVHRQNGWRIGMLGSYPVAAKTMDIELCFSRDGQRWERPLRVPWIRREDGEEAAPNRLVEMGDDWLLLYTASPCRHGGVHNSEQERATVRAARFPKNRFMGLATDADGIGRLWTRPFVVGDTELCIDACMDGCLRAELCDPFGKTLPGFESDRCRLVSGDRVDHVLRWEGAAGAPYQYNAVSLRLEKEAPSALQLKIATCQFPVSRDIGRQMEEARKRGAHLAHFSKACLGGTRESISTRSPATTGMLYASVSGKYAIWPASSNYGSFWDRTTRSRAGTSRTTACTSLTIAARLSTATTKCSAPRARTVPKAIWTSTVRGRAWSSSRYKASAAACRYATIFAIRNCTGSTKTRGATDVPLVPQRGHDAKQESGGARASAPVSRCGPTASSTVGCRCTGPVYCFKL